MFGYADINGDATPGSEIEVRDSADALIGTTTADDCGKWSIQAARLPVGHHQIHAVAAEDNRRVNKSRPIGVTVYEPLEITATGAQSEPDDDDTQSRALGLYGRVVDCLASGVDLDADALAFACEAVGQTLDDLQRDVDERLALRDALEADVARLEWLEDVAARESRCRR